MEQPVQTNFPNIDIDPFTQHWADKSEFATSGARKAQLKRDARLFANFVIETIINVHSKCEVEQKGKVTYYVTNKNDNPRDTLLFARLQKDISKQCATMSEKISISTKNTNATYASEMDLESLFLQYQEEVQYEIKNLSLKAQISVLTTASNNETPALKDWQACLNQLLEDAGTDKAKRTGVACYVKATQGLLKNPSSEKAGYAFAVMLADLSEKANEVKLYKKIVEKGVSFLIAVVFGVFLALAASNPVVLGVALIIGAALLFANFYKSETPEGHLSESISDLFDKMGFFSYEKAYEAASHWHNPNNQPVKFGPEQKL